MERAGAKPGVRETVMKIGTRLLYLLSFAALATVAALALDRALQPSMSAVLLRAVIIASLAGAPGLIHRRAWPAALVLLPVGAYLLLRMTLPLPDTVEGWQAQYGFYVDRLREGGQAYLEDVFPLKVGIVPGLRLLVGLSVYAVSGAAALLALSLRRALPAAGLLMLLMGFSLTVDAATRLLWPALMFLVLAACLLVLSHGLRRTGWRLRDAVAGGAVGAVAAVLALVLLTAAPSAAATPWRDWRTWDPFQQEGSVYTFNWMQNYPRLLDPARDQDILQVISPMPSYWRANALDVFTGSAWVTSQAFLPGPEPEQDAGSWTYSLPAAGPVPPGETVTQTFQIRSVYTNYLFTGGEALRLRMNDRVALRLNDMRALHVREVLGPTLDYTLDTVVPQLEPDELIGRGRDYPEELSTYLSLPFPTLTDIQTPDAPDGAGETLWRDSAAPPNGLSGNWEWADLYALNENIVQEATDPYDVTLRIEKRLRQDYDYSLTPPGSEYASPYAAFLFDTRSGYCQHFAGSMALLLRFNGIPARVAVGFTTGDEESENVYTVSTGNAHAWVEVFFSDFGWVAFDPTPGRSIPAPGPSSTSPGFINPFTEDLDDGDVTPVTQPEETLDPSRLGPEDQGVGEGVSGGGMPRWLWTLIGVVAAAAIWPAVRVLWRRRHLRRGPLEERVAASLRLLQDELSVYRLSVSPGDTLEDTVGLLTSHLRVDIEPAFVERTEAVLFGGRVATARDLDRTEALRRRVKTALRRRYGWLRAALASYGFVAASRDLASADIQ